MAKPVKTDAEIYNVRSYNDEELYDILDLSNPTDRELESKLLFLIHKYENMQTADGNKLAKFFDDIYNHFFKDETELQIRKEKDPSQNATGLQKIENGQLIDYNIVKGNVQVTNTQPVKPAAPNNNNTIMQKTQDLPAGTSSTLYTKSLDYAPDKLNPILQQTTRRVISIDSQYRDNKSSISTEFTFNLSETLKDVVSMKLYSIQIPYTWYTVNNSFGSNFIFLKGITPGIDNGNHNIQIDISAGNYDPLTLTSALNSSVERHKTVYSDVSFGNTRFFNYNISTVLSTINVDITKRYNENSYILEFPGWTTPYLQTDVSRNTSIPSYLGFEQQTYDINVVNSRQLFHSYSNNDSKDYQLSNSNNYFTVIKYIGPDEYIAGTNVIDLSFNIKLSLSTVSGVKWSRNDILTDLNIQLIASPYVSNESYITRFQVDSSNNLPDTYYYRLKIKPNRHTTQNLLNSKIVIQFPVEVPTADYNIWTSNSTILNSCFGFSTKILNGTTSTTSYLNELSNIVGEFPSVKQDKYVIDGSPYIQVKCNALHFDVSENHIQIDVSNNAGYTMTQYMAAINTGIRNAYKIGDASKTAISSTILNAPLSTYVYDNTSVPTGTYGYVDNKDTFNLYLNINKTFDASAYELDLSNTILYQILDLSNSVTVIPGSITYTSNILMANGIQINNGAVIANIRPLSNSSFGNQNDISYNIKYTDDSQVYTNIGILTAKINSLFSSYIDTFTGQNIFNGTYLSYNPTPDSAGKTAFTFNLKVNKTLTAKNYSIRFISPITTSNIDSWRDHLKIDALMNGNNPFSLIDTSYNTATPPVKIVSVENNQATIIASASIPPKSILTLTSNNNTIRLIAYEDGVQSPNGENNITIRVPTGTYSRNTLISTINSLISANVSSQTTAVPSISGSVISIFATPDGLEYAKLRITLNRTYTAKDYNMVFYDPFSFVKCYVGVTSVRNTTWDTTLGWLLGFHKYTVYYLKTYGGDGIISLTGDTVVNTNLFNYFMLCLDDYNQNHLNDGLVTLTGKDLSIPLPSYTNRSSFVCDPVTGQSTYSSSTGNTQLTQNQIYAINEIANNASTAVVNNESAINSKSHGKSYGLGPFVKDVFGLIPMKVAGLTPGASFIEYGGTLQNQDRLYFGPVNVRRMSVKLVSDRGDVVDLNGANWSFSLICESLNKLSPPSTK